MARLRASFVSTCILRSSAVVLCFFAGAASGSLHRGHRLAKPGLSGFNSNSWEQTAQIRRGKAIRIL